FFFSSRRRHTRWPRDWSSDVCSSDLSAYAQIEPLEKEYEGKLQQFSVLYERARERDSHRGWLDLERLRGRHHPETWEKMSEIIEIGRASCRERGEKSDGAGSVKGKEE